MYLFAGMNVEAAGFERINREIEALERMGRETEYAALRRVLGKITQRDYESDWCNFAAWCEKNNCQALPASSKALRRYLLEKSSRLSKATLDRSLVAISHVHRENGHVSPTRTIDSRRLMKWLREVRLRQSQATRPLLVEDLAKVLEKIDGETTRGKRDRALLLIGFAAALRRSELVGINCEDLNFTSEGLTLRISSFDPGHRDYYQITIPNDKRSVTCAVTQLRSWLALLNAQEGPVFRPILKNGVIRPTRLNGASVSGILKIRLANAGFSAEAFSTRSLRAGLAMTAVLAKTPDWQVMQRTRQRVRIQVPTSRKSVFEDNVVSSLNL